MTFDEVLAQGALVTEQGFALYPAWGMLPQGWAPAEAPRAAVSWLCVEGTCKAHRG
jgi:hypothetical protein